MARLLITPLAKSDLSEIWTYIAEHNRSAADELLQQIDQMMTSIASTPSLGFPLDEVRTGVRCKPVKRNYLIFYSMKDECVRILRVLHAARNYEELL